MLCIVRNSCTYQYTYKTDEMQYCVALNSVALESLLFQLRGVNFTPCTEWEVSISIMNLVTLFSRQCLK